MALPAGDLGCPGLLLAQPGGNLWLPRLFPRLALMLTLILAMDHCALISIFKKINLFFSFPCGLSLPPSLPSHLHPCYIHVRTYTNTRARTNTHTWSASFPPPKDSAPHGLSVFSPWPPSFPLPPPSLPSPLQAQLSHPVRQLSWERTFPKTEAGCERPRSGGRASGQTAQARQAGGRRRPCPPLLVWVPDFPLLLLRWIFLPLLSDCHRALQLW